MVAGISASGRVVLVLVALLLATPAGAGGRAAAPEVAVVAPVFQTTVADLGTGPHALTVSRIFFTPGSRELSVSLPGPRMVLVESGTIGFRATGVVPVVQAAIARGADGGTGSPTAIPTATAVPTPGPTSSPTTDQLLQPGDVAPVPIWTMHSLRNDGAETAVVLDVRITGGDDPKLPSGLDIEYLAEVTGLTALPTGRAAVALGRSTLAPGGMVLAPPAERYQLVAGVDGDGVLAPADNGTVPNAAAEPSDVFVLGIAPAGQGGRRAPEQPATGPGGAEVAFDRVVATRHGPEHAGGFWLFEPAGARPGSELATDGPLPVVLFVGGCCTGIGDQEMSNAPSDVQAWLDHLTQRGAIVIYPEMRPDHFREDNAAALRSAIAELERDGHAAADWDRFAVFGYSFGGWYAPVYAATAAADGLPVPQAVFSTVAFDPGTNPDLGAIPSLTRVVVLVDDDEFGWSDHGARRLWAALTGIPPDRRAFVHLVTDNHGVPALFADHQVAATGDYGSTNALDWYGTWKIGDALLSCAFAEQDCHYAFGDTPELRFMGFWSDGMPVNELQVIADPGPPDPETPTPTA